MTSSRILVNESLGLMILPLNWIPLFPALGVWLPPNFSVGEHPANGRSESLLLVSVLTQSRKDLLSRHVSAMWGKSEKVGWGAQAQLHCQWWQRLERRARSARAYLGSWWHCGNFLGFIICFQVRGRVLRAKNKEENNILNVSYSIGCPQLAIIYFWWGVCESMEQKKQKNRIHHPNKCQISRYGTYLESP